MSGNDDLSATLSAILYCLLEAFLKVELLSFNKNGLLEGRLYFKGTDEILSTSNFFHILNPPRPVINGFENLSPRGLIHRGVKYSPKHHSAKY